MIRCRLCAQDIDHCHGTLIVTEIDVVCSEPECWDLEVERHDIVIDVAWEIPARRAAAS